jgi:hypothetical protein
VWEVGRELRVILKDGKVFDVEMRDSTGG